MKEEDFDTPYNSLSTDEVHELFEQTLFIVRDPQLLPRLSHLPHVSLATPPAHSNSSLTYKATILANLAQMQMRILVWSFSLPLTRTPLSLVKSNNTGRTLKHQLPVDFLQYCLYSSCHQIR